MISTEAVLDAAETTTSPEVRYRQAVITGELDGWLLDPQGGGWDGLPPEHKVVFDDACRTAGEYVKHRRIFSRRVTESRALADGIPAAESAAAALKVESARLKKLVSAPMTGDLVEMLRRELIAMGSPFRLYDAEEFAPARQAILDRAAALDDQSAYKALAVWEWRTRALGYLVDTAGDAPDCGVSALRRQIDSAEARIQSRQPIVEIDSAIAAARERCDEIASGRRVPESNEIPTIRHDTTAAAAEAFRQAKKKLNGLLAVAKEKPAALAENEADRDLLNTLRADLHDAQQKQQEWRARPENMQWD